jgi:hypothetical protein
MLLTTIHGDAKLTNAHHEKPGHRALTSSQNEKPLAPKNRPELLLATAPSPNFPADQENASGRRRRDVIALTVSSNRRGNCLQALLIDLLAQEWWRFQPVAR